MSDLPAARRSFRLAFGSFLGAPNPEEFAGEAQDVYNRLERVMKVAFNDVVKIRAERNVSMRAAANMLRVSRVAEAVKLRGLHP
jgi:glutamate dehydrogenase (NAD(P)+)